MPVLVRIDDLSTPEVHALIVEHVAEMRGHSPADHAHALAVDGLRSPDITFFTAWQQGRLAGCGALRELDATSGEVKSMRTRAAFLRQGIGQAVLDTIVAAARQRGYRQLFLETGTGPAFAAAQALYERNGFVSCGPFGSYRSTDFNVFLRRAL